MQRPRMRPRFIVDVETDADTILCALRAGLAASQPALVGVFTERHGVIRIPESRRHFWSPQLDVLVQAAENEPGHSRIVVRFAPQPHIWLAFIYTYGVLFALGLAGMMYAMAELSLGRTPWCAASTLAAAGLAAFVYGAAFIGQGLGANDMFELRTWLEQCFADARERGQRATASPRDSAQL